MALSGCEGVQAEVDGTTATVAPSSERDKSTPEAAPAATIAPSLERDNSTPEAALAAIFAELHERDIEGACMYFDPTFERTFLSDGDCEKTVKYVDEVNLDLMGDVEITSKYTIYLEEDGTAFIPAASLFWPDGGPEWNGGLFIERENGWFKTFDPEGES
ncbi:hypothetical protein ATL42_1673 [Sanguibacter antarcticus]|uniref:Uncharacterized protein n=2 Tax=Sanguibacter antarcticus TaxID=372484 RepID=A0A2A9E4L3_9MICO|nr:hypothetical protein ATL42_1673 [Sanguibacter antarcticus]